MLRLWNPKGRARAEMVLGPFAETKGPRRTGAKPRKNKLVGDAHPTEARERLFGMEEDFGR